MKIKFYDICWVADEDEIGELPYAEEVEVKVEPEDTRAEVLERASICLAEKYDYDIGNYRYTVCA